MNRRTYLATLAAALTASAAGCNSTESTPTSRPPTETTSTPTSTQETTTTASSMTVSAEDVQADTPDVELDIRYATRTQQRLPTEPVTLAEDGHTWLLVRMDITNRGADPRDLRMFQYVLYAGGDLHEPIMTDEPWAVAEQSAAPGETVTGWVTFHPETSLREGVLTIRDNTQAAFDVTFTHDSSLDAQIPD
ncbi:hypothetical protein U3A55_11930 [Salarchaeum sp. III]|uniref:hypothetical protein n=1 Tax=Salarchaeum sp. III TaxID=3107927 RepID=UPI002ED81A01